MIATMGVWDAISSGSMPSWDDVRETGGNAATGIADGARAAGGAIASGAEYVADGAVSLGSAAYGYGERAVSGAYHGLTDWHFEGRDARNGPAPSQADLDGGNGWVKQPDWMAELHQDPNVEGREVKYVNEDGRESIRYPGAGGGEVTDDRYRGTYNYVNPGNWDQLQNQGQVLGVPVGGAAEWAARGVGHFATDILPWWLGGTVRGPG